MGKLNNMTKEEKAIYHKAWRERNKDKIKADKQAYHISNKDEIKAKDKLYYEANAEVIKNKQKKYYEANKDKVKKYIQTYNKTNPDVQRKTQYKRKFGITLDDYDKMFDIQEGKCSICTKHQSELKKLLHVDHNHETGKIRGLLCGDCNLALGMFKDNETLLTNAIKYLLVNG